MSFPGLNLQKLIVLSIFILVIFSCSKKQEKTFDIFHGGTILTVDESFSEVEALVMEDGRIVATGSLDMMQGKFGKKANMIDLNGQTMLPGFIDPHAHVVSFAPIVFLTEE